MESTLIIKRASYYSTTVIYVTYSTIVTLCRNFSHSNATVITQQLSPLDRLQRPGSTPQCPCLRVVCGKPIYKYASFRTACTRVLLSIAIFEWISTLIIFQIISVQVYNTRSFLTLCSIRATSLRDIIQIGAQIGTTIRAFVYDSYLVRKYKARSVLYT